MSTGIRTIADLHDRCRVDDETGCWEWAGALSGGYPRVWAPHPKTGVMSNINGNVAAWTLSGKELREGHIVYRHCGNGICCNPDHMRLGTKRQACAHLVKIGSLRGRPGASAANTIAARKRSRLTLDAVRQIRASDEPNTHLAIRLGVCHNTVANVRRNRTWREVSPGASVFNMVPA